MAAVAVALDGLALTGAVRLVVALVRSVVVRGVDLVPAVLVDVALVRDRVVAAADHDRGRRAFLVGVVRTVVRLRSRLRRLTRGAAAVSCDGLALTGAVGLVVGL